MSRVQGALSTVNDLIGMTMGLDIPCDKPPDKSCLRNKKVVYGGQLPPKVYDGLCPACRAHWHAQMARNALVEFARTR